MAPLCHITSALLATIVAAGVSEGSFVMTKHVKVSIPDSDWNSHTSRPAPTPTACASAALKMASYFHSYDKANGVCEIGSADLAESGSGNKDIMVRGRILNKAFFSRKNIVLFFYRYTLGGPESGKQRHGQTHRHCPP